MNTKNQVSKCYSEIERNYLGGHLEVAEDLADQLVKKIPQDPKLRLLRAHIYYSLGELKNARYEYELTRGLTTDEDLIDQALHGLERCESIYQDNIFPTSDATIIVPVSTIATLPEPENLLPNQKEEDLSCLDKNFSSNELNHHTKENLNYLSEDQSQSLSIIDRPDTLESLHILQADEFLPPINRWFHIAGMVLVTTLAGSAVLSAFLKYQVVVKAPSIIRPIGEVRLVQSAVEGKVRQISVELNQEVKKGEPITVIDDSQQLIRKSQLIDEITRNQQKLTQIRSQISSVEEEMLAESSKVLRGVDINQAELQTAKASLELAQEEYQRFSQLASDGAIADLLVQEKLANFRVAQSNFVRAQEVTKQTRDQGSAIQARLKQVKEQLLQQESDVIQQVNMQQQELKRINIDLENMIIRAPITGIIQSLSLRNPEQVVSVGQEIAQISPSQGGVVAKALVPSQNILPVVIGQPVQLRISACPYPDFGTLDAVVKNIAPDTGRTANSIVQASSVNQESSANPGYEVTMDLKELTLSDRSRVCTVRPGMEAQADILTEEETLLKFILRKARLMLP